MKIDSKTYETISSDMLTRHYVYIGNQKHVLNTRELWQLALLAIVQLGEYLKEDRVPIGDGDDPNS